VLDIKFIRENPKKIKKALSDRGTKLNVDDLLKLDSDRRKLLTEVEGLKAERNTVSDEIACLKKDKQGAEDKISAMKEVSIRIKELDKQVADIEENLQSLVTNIPNIPHETVPVGPDEKSNQPIKEWGKPRKFNFKPEDHIALAEKLDIIDFERSAKISGSNFILFKGAGARLERALINFMLDLHITKHGYTEIFPPFLVNRASMYGTGQLPKLEKDMYKLEDEDLFLIPTAEVPVTNLHANEVIKEEDLPICYTAYTACFRKEAGSYGKDTKGMKRVHQFDKVEMVKFVKPEDSWNELETLLLNAEEVLQKLKIPYKVAALSTGDLSFAASKCYDINAWAPGSNEWLEVSSCSNFTDFQARRANIKFQRATQDSKRETQFVHTLNGSGIALARTVICILENYQERDGSIRIPKALVPYMGKIKVIKG